MLFLLLALSMATAEPTADAAEAQAEIYAARKYPEFTSTSTCTPVGIDSDGRMVCAIHLGVQGKPVEATATVRCHAGSEKFKLGLCSEK